MSIEEAARPRFRVLLNGSALLLTLIAATTLRAWDLGRLSFWYDEVVTMRLAETPSIADLFRLLFQIDATRAPLHPLFLQDWLAVFGNSEAAGRSLSVVFGVATVALLYFLGRLAFDESTGLWSAFLGAFSPLMVYYSREARMYALLTMLTTLCWAMLFWNRRTPSRSRTIAYAVCLVAMLFTHPLGLLMLGTLGLASALDVRAFFGSWKGWLAVHLGVLIVTAPWLRFYFDHAPEFLSGRLPIKFLLATPIGFLGGDSKIYLAILALIAFGLYRRRIVDSARPASRLLAIINTGYRKHAFSPRGRRWPERPDEGDATGSDAPLIRPFGAPSPARGEGNPALDLHATPFQTALTPRAWVAPACLILWLVLPPTILYVYSWIASPIFGPARYTLFCAPAYLVLVAQALARIPPLSRWTLGLGLACLAVASMRTMVYAPHLKADWRSMSKVVLVQASRATTKSTIMIATDAEPNLEVETARYYLGRPFPVVPFDEEELKTLLNQPSGKVDLIVAGRSPHEISPDLVERLRPYITGVNRLRFGLLRWYELGTPPLQPPARVPAFRPAPAPAAPARPAPD